MMKELVPDIVPTPTDWYLLVGTSFEPCEPVLLPYALLGGLSACLAHPNCHCWCNSPAEATLPMAWGVGVMLWFRLGSRLLLLCRKRT